MIELALQGSKKYWAWVAFLVLVIGIGAIAYGFQLRDGLGITGLSRDVSWGLYIAQLTFLVGVAASGVMVVLPYYLHDYKAFGRITILGEFLAVPAIVLCGLFIIVDLGNPQRFFNVFLHPSPKSIVFWDVVVLNVYMVLNLIIGFFTLGAARKNIPPPSWIKPLIYLSIPWAISIHTVTAFVYAGMPGRGFWLTAIMAPRFLASAFAAGPSVLILISLVIRKVTWFDAGREALQALAKIVTYAIIAHLFFFFLEVFTIVYSNIPGHLDHLVYLYKGLHGFTKMVPWTWSALVMGFAAIPLLLVPKWRSNLSILAIACLLVLGCTWIDKGMALMAGGFIPSPLHEITEYLPNHIEILVALGLYGLGGLILTFLYKIALGVRWEVEH
jgi:Ni/Fe-hydrogenase subunit HybB-like protein